MKVAIITPGFGEPTIPFAQNLCRAGCSCDMFILSLQGRTNCGTLDFDDPIEGYSIYQLNKDNNIYKYLNKKINIFNVPYFLEKYKRYLVGFIAYFLNKRIVKKLTLRIKNNSYDVVYVVAHEMIDIMVCKMLKKSNIPNVYISYHEILCNHLESQQLSIVVKKTMGLGYSLLTYSEYNRNILERMTSCKVNTLYFGPFETYSSFDTSVRMIDEEYVLFIGNIQPYKGLPFLYETICEYYSNSSYKIVVAGSGYDEILNDIKKDSRFILINRYLTDKEFANLTKYANCVICPYKSGSQSGITHTAMVFGTPVIATNVAAFPEFIIDGENGYIVEYGDKASLAEKIRYYVTSKKRNVTIPYYLNWNHIISSFYEIVHQ